MNLAPFKQLIKTRCGLHFEESGNRPLAQALSQRISASGAANNTAYFQILQQDENEFHLLVELLTINETYFYREPEQIEFVIDKLVPRLLSRRAENAGLRILSLGCSTGEELYSIAIALHEKFGAGAMPRFYLAGADIDNTALHKARAARYKEFSFRGLDPDLRARYFEAHDAFSWQLKPELRKQTHFHHFNLLAGKIPPSLTNFDLIFFRNVSIYFDKATRLTALQQLTELLQADGYLIVGCAETMANDLGIFSLVAEDQLFYFAQGSGAAEQAPASASHAVLSAKSGKPAGTPEWLIAGPPQRLPQPQQPSADMPATATISAQQCLALIADKRYLPAQAALDQWLTQQPDHIPALLLRAYLELQRKNFAAAQELAQRVLKQDAWSVDALVLCALATKWQGRTEPAMEYFKQAVYTCQDCWPAHYYLAELYRAAGQIEQAARAYNMALRILLNAEQSAGKLNDGLSTIPLGLPAKEVRFLCQHQIKQLELTRQRGEL